MDGKYAQVIQTVQDEMEIPQYLHSKSKHTFTMHQLFIMLVLMQYEAKTYRAFVDFLETSSEIRTHMGLTTIPHCTTLQKAKARLDAGTLHSMFVSSTASAEAIVGADATGFETRHASSHYASRCHLRHAFTKMSAISDMTMQLVGAIVIVYHPVRYISNIFQSCLRGCQS